MKKLGIIDSGTRLSPLDTHSWEAEKSKKAMARRMETYAAMITIMDNGIGKIVSELKKERIFDNTVIFFLQDNGACAEGAGGKVHPLAKDTAGLKPLGKNEIQLNVWAPITRDGRIVMAGRNVMAGPADSYVPYLKPWANASNTPLRKYKHFVHEGGISTPLIVHWPAGIKHKGKIIKDVVGHEIDIMPTIVELAHAKYPDTYKGNQIVPEQGLSLVGTFSGDTLPPRALYWEHEQNRAVRMGKWKLVCYSNLNFGKKTYRLHPWELYDIKQDRSETNNLATRYPDIVKKMAGMWNKWAWRTHVFPAPWKQVK
jgi:arylsulfatase